MGKILIIDDDPDVRTVMTIFLKKQGYSVESAARAEDAWEKLTSFLPSLVLLDVLLSGSDGRLLCRQIKEGEATRAVHVIMFSAHPGASSSVGQYGADAFVAKPFNLEQLLDKVVHFIGRPAQI